MVRILIMDHPDSEKADVLLYHYGFDETIQITMNSRLFLEVL